MEDINTFKDIQKLVNAFYAKVRKDALLGPIFNGHIAEDQWPAHLEKLSRFWESNLFGVTGFRANPRAKHLAVDHNLHHTIEPKHFETWLQLWFQTIDQLYSGPVAEQAKSMAMSMASGQFAMIMRNRPENLI